MDKFMAEALKEAQKAYEKDEVPVGAVIVNDGKIIARAHNLKETKNSALAHAEILCIEKASKKLNNWRLNDSVLYVTLKPCKMCNEVIRESRIKHVYYGAIDELHRSEESELYTYSNECECSEILKSFFRDLRKNKEK